MLSNLEDIMNDIYTEVQTKLIPENIKQGINILNVEGSLQTMPINIVNITDTSASVNNSTLIINNGSSSN